MVRRASTRLERGNCIRVHPLLHGPQPALGGLAVEDAIGDNTSVKIKGHQRRGSRWQTHSAAAVAVARPGRSRQRRRVEHGLVTGCHQGLWNGHGLDDSFGCRGRGAGAVPLVLRQQPHVGAMQECQARRLLHVLATYLQRFQLGRAAPGDGLRGGGLLASRGLEPWRRHCRAGSCRCTGRSRGSLRAPPRHVKACRLTRKRARRRSRGPAPRIARVVKTCQLSLGAPRAGHRAAAPRLLRLARVACPARLGLPARVADRLWPFARCSRPLSAAAETRRSAVEIRRRGCHAGEPKIRQGDAGNAKGQESERKRSPATSRVFSFPSFEPLAKVRGGLDPSLCRSRIPGFAVHPQPLEPPWTFNSSNPGFLALAYTWPLGSPWGRDP